MLIKALILSLLACIHGMWGGYGGGYGYGNQGPPYPNNNLGIGYPTAYGLWLGRNLNGNGWGNGWEGQGGGIPGQGTGFGSPLRCLNGGAHIGQCRLDKDSICIALGGSCIHGACCTTPFVGLGTSTTPAPVIDGEVTLQPSVTVPPPRLTTVEAITETGVDKIDSSEIAEWNSLVEKARSSTTTTKSMLLPQVTLGPDKEDSMQCDSGLRAVGPCQDDDDCPSLHVCEKNLCCYIV